MTERSKSAVGAGGPTYRVLCRMVRLEPSEVAPMLWSAAFFFFVLSSNLVLRALRGQIGVSAGRENLPDLFTATFVTMIVANGLYWTLVNRVPKRRFVPFTYHVIAASLLLLYFLLRSTPEDSQDGIKFTFFVWYSVINLFTVCLFWVCMVDFFTHEQGKRLFAFIGIGGTLGGISGSLLAANTVHELGNDGLLLLSLGFLEIAVFCGARLGKLGRSDSVHDATGADAAKEIASGGILTGLKLAVESRYLRMIGFYIFLTGCLGTGLYLHQVEIVAAAYSSEEDRTAYSAWVDFAMQTLVLLVQIFLTARLFRFLGVGGTLLILPVFATVGVLALGFFPILSVLFVVQVLFGAGRHSLAKPAREVLFTVVGVEEKYKSKSFTDTFVPRMADAGASWVLGPLPATAVSWVVLPLALLWSFLGPGLGRMHRALIRSGGTG